jgi:hypothetical protein
MAASWAVSKYKNIRNKSTERNAANGDEGIEGFAAWISLPPPVENSLSKALVRRDDIVSTVRVNRISR